MEIDLDTLSKVSSIVIAGLGVVLTYIILRLTAKPKIRISLNQEKSLTFRPGETIKLTFHLRNTGQWYGRPPATDVKVYVNFDQSFELEQVRFGSDLEKMKGKDEVTSW